MRISIEHKGAIVSVDVDRMPSSKNQALQLFGAMYDMYANILHGEDSKSVPMPDPVITTPAPVSAKPEVSDFNIRQRLPNSIVDVKDLDIKQAVTESALVRCPHCGQSHVLAVNSGNHIYVMRKFYAVAGSDEFRIIAEFDSLTSQDFINMCCKPETDRKAYFDDIQRVKMIDDKDFAVTNETAIFCPVCCQSDTFMAWKNAFDNPLEYFETEYLCDACGGEMIPKMVKNNKVCQCEKCNYTTQYKEE